MHFFKSRTHTVNDSGYDFDWMFLEIPVDWGTVVNMPLNTDDTNLPRLLRHSTWDWLLILSNPCNYNIMESTMSKKQTSQQHFIQTNHIMSSQEGAPSFLKKRIFVTSNISNFSPSQPTTINSHKSAQMQVQVQAHFCFYR